MGWCSGTDLFDDMAAFILNSGQSEDQKVATLARLATAMEDQDWDCQMDSMYRDDPIVKRVFHQLHPGWYPDDDVKRIDRLIGNLDEPIKSAVRLLMSYAQVDGGHHKAWCLDQVTRALLGVHYSAFISAYEEGEDGRHTYTWDEGVAP